MSSLRLPIRGGGGWCCWCPIWLLSLALIGIISAGEREPTTGNQQQPAASYMITPKEYLQLRSQLCNKTPPNEVSNGTTSHRLAELGRVWFRDQGPWADHCEREPAAWRWAYVHELDQLQVLVGHQSIDQRLANGLYTSTTAKIFDIDIYRYHSGEPGEDARNQELVAGQQVDDERCGVHLNAMLNLIRELEERNEQLRRRPRTDWPDEPMDERFLRLARALDSFGRYESGHLLGKTMVPGAYEQCLRSQLLLPSGGGGDVELVNTRFCWARLKLDDAHLDESLRARPMVELTNAGQNSLLAGVCLPVTCHSKSFQANRGHLQQLVDSQFRLPKWMYVNETLELDSIFCLVDEDSQYSMPLGGKLLLLGLATWTLLAIYVTYSWKQPAAAAAAAAPKSSNSWLQVLDLNESWRQFLCEKEDCLQDSRATTKRRVQLDALNMLKVFFSGVVVVGHSMLVSAGYSMEELRYLHFADKDFTINGMFTATLTVDTYFTITGLLMAYLTMRRLARYQKDQHQQHQHQQHQHQHQQQHQMHQRKTQKCKNVNQFKWPTFLGQWLVFTVNRYLRVVPLLALVYWFKRWVFIYLGSGPFWDFGLNKNTKHGACVREHWLVPFTFWSAYLPLSRQCLLQSWSISNDLFFSLVAPPILLLLYTRPRLATIISSLACLASLWAGFVAMNGIRPDLVWEMRDLKVYGLLRFYSLVSELYSAPHLRVSSLLIGVLAGYNLYYYNERIDSRSSHPPTSDAANKWPRWFTGPATRGAIFIIVLLLVAIPLGPLVKAHLSPYHRLAYVHLMTSFRVVWALANAVLFVRLTTDWSLTKFGRMSSCRFWRVASRLNYAILLLHLDILLFNAQFARTTQMFSKWAFLSAAASAYLFCIPMAMYLHIFIENPLEKLLRIGDTDTATRRPKAA